MHRPAPHSPHHSHSRCCTYFLQNCASEPTRRLPPRNQGSAPHALPTTSPSDHCHILAYCKTLFLYFKRPVTHNSCSPAGQRRACSWHGANTFNQKYRTYYAPAPYRQPGAKDRPTSNITMATHGSLQMTQLALGYPAWSRQTSDMGFRHDRRWRRTCTRRGRYGPTS